MSKYHIECITEEILLLNLGKTRDSILHHPGSGAVCRALDEGTNLFGLIDEDPERTFQHDYYDKLYPKPESDKYNIRFSVDKKKKNKLVFIKPRFEPWIIEVAQSSDLNMSDFNLSDNSDILHREISFKRGDLQKLIHHLVRIKNPAIIHLKKLFNS